MPFGFIPDTLFLALLTSTILAGLRRSTGLTFQTTQLIANPTGGKIFSIYLGAGEWTFDRLAGWAKGSKFFKYDPSVTVNEVKSQVSGFAEGMKVAAALVGEFGSGFGGGAAANGNGTGSGGAATAGVKHE
ncbi:hypothetical protein BD289DRAFT_421914 [Coniella lustricola]|uniref:Uncharacterized protein n=1 Tax=Coniella lustricola TaxID=2025994 RepID=A0A2T3AL25_9PEZI|nr:hypothetical protein BD289DRAFT_421914 [Coniella lustricola]